MDKRLTIAAGVVALAGAYWAYQWLGTATVAVSSEPDGAVVRVDGRQRGITPLKRLELDTGSHRLQVEHSHYAAYVEGLDLSRGDHLERHVTFRPGEGTFSLLSNPRGAWVEIDGERLREPTPTSHSLPSGEHVIAMGQAERHIVEETHTIKDGETREVNFNLNIDPHGSVTINTSPRNATVEILDEDVDYAPKMRLQIGEYAVRVSAPGYVTQEFRHQVRYGDNVHQVALQRAYGNLNVTAQPATAEVTVTYSDGGRTYREPYVAGMRLPAGRVEVRARAVGHRTAFKRIDLAPAGTSKATFRLERMQVEPGSVFTDPLQDGGQSPEMVVIPAGKFRMGNAQGPPSEQPVRQIILTQPFAVSRHEISIGDYLRFADATGARLHDRVDREKRDHAMAYVTFEEGAKYAAWLSAQTREKYRLPSEAEWEYVARAGSDARYFFGDDAAQLCEYANIADLAARASFREWDVVACDDGFVRPGPVGSHRPNPFGVYDIYGNVSEWVLDCGMPSYEDAPADGSAATEGESCESHGFRGGSWDSRAPEVTSAYRNTASSANDDRGLRLVREL